MICANCSDSTYDYIEMIPVLDVHPWTGDTTASMHCPTCGTVEEASHGVSETDLAFAIA